MEIQTRANAHIRSAVLVDMFKLVAASSWVIPTKNRSFTAVAAGKQPSPEDLNPLNRALADVPTRRVVVGGDGFRWGWGGDETALERMLWPVIQSAAELLISDDRKRVRQCADKHCTRLFVDRRSGLRRWCDPNTCGSREKGKRLYRSGGRVRF